MYSNQTKHYSMEKKMFYKTSPLLFGMAKELRNHVTNAEMLLWGYLRTKPDGFKFRRQHPLGIFIADFYCHRLKLVIEVDGSIHKIKEVEEHDRYRQRLIEEDGMKLIRFTNEQIETDFENVIVRIQELLHV